MIVIPTLNKYSSSYNKKLSQILHKNYYEKLIANTDKNHDTKYILVSSLIALKCYKTEGAFFYIKNSNSFVLPSISAISPLKNDKKWCLWIKFAKQIKLFSFVLGGSVAYLFSLEFFIVWALLRLMIGSFFVVRSFSLFKFN